MACLGPFCGYFRDELEADSDEEESEDDDTEKASSRMTGEKAKKKKRKVRRWRKKQEDGRGHGSAKMRWAQYLHQVEVKVKARGGVEMVQQVSELRADSQAHLTHGMMKCISQLPKLHAIEIIGCHVDEVPPLLSDCESLVILRMSHNRLRKFSEDFARCSLLEQIIIDWNDISEIAAGIFNSQGFKHLEVINIAHNSLSHLPPDFGITCKSTVRQIDLSNNQIASLPDSILNCKFLEELNLSHNRLKQLTREFKFTKLQRLYLSFNELTCLPEDIGKCVSMTKIRIIDNQIKELPDSIVELWPKNPKGHGGKLEQFLVERNPLVMPSITAFEMDNGGIDRAFQLLYENIQEKAEKKKLALEVKAIQAEEEAQRPPALEDLRTRTMSGESSTLEATLEGTQASEEAAGVNPAEYYFAHCQNDAPQITEIRDAESTLLLIKKDMFLGAQKRLAEEVLESGDPMPESLQLFLEKDYQDKFKGIVPVRDLDLYFNLLVFSMKPQFPSCQQLFIKYEDGNKGYITREEWNEFCLCVPIHINDSIRNQMWQLMSFRRSEHDRVSLNDFVAAFQIHDIEAQDPFIASMTKVLQLDYYDMTVRELRERVRAEGAKDATPQLDFDNPEERPNLREHAVALQDSAGIRCLDERLLEAAERQEKEAAKNMMKSSSLVSAGANKRPLSVTLTDSAYQADLHGNERAADDENRKDDDSEASDLSAESDTQDEAFDAPTQLRRQEMRQKGLEAAKPANKIAIDSDEAIRKLMELPTDNFLSGLLFQDMETDEGGAANPKAAANPEQEEEGKEGHTRQDLFMVRRALRHVHRNMPHTNFVSLINYLLRALQMVKHQGGHVYWHADDPSFKHVLGEKATNEYTRKLLLQLGFVRLSEVHWVWPNPIFDTPHRVISKEADKYRLDSMIVLLKSCQMSLYKTGSQFTGNFSLLR